MDIQVWADFHCPYCMIGKQRLYRALRELGITDYTVTPRSFMLNPDSREPEGLPMADHVINDYGGEKEQVLRDFEQVDAMARGEGLSISMEKSRYASMMDAHRLFQYAKTLGRGNPFFERAQEAVFTKGLVLSNPEVLLRIAEETGLNRQEAAQVLSSGAYRAEVLLDDAVARRMAIDYVPYFIFNGTHHFSGDRSYPEYLQALSQAREGGEAS